MFKEHCQQHACLGAVKCPGTYEYVRGCSPKSPENTHCKSETPGGELSSATPHIAAVAPIFGNFFLCVNYIGKYLTVVVCVVRSVVTFGTIDIRAIQKAWFAACLKVEAKTMFCENTIESIVDTFFFSQHCVVLFFKCAASFAHHVLWTVLALLWMPRWSVVFSVNHY